MIEEVTSAIAELMFLSVVGSSLADFRRKSQKGLKNSKYEKKSENPFFPLWGLNPIFIYLSQKIWDVLSVFRPSFADLRLENDKNALKNSKLKTLFSRGGDWTQFPILSYLTKKISCDRCVPVKQTYIQKWIHTYKQIQGNSGKWKIFRLAWYWLVNTTCRFVKQYRLVNNTG